MGFVGIIAIIGIVGLNPLLVTEIKQIATMAMASTIQQQSSPLSWVHCNNCNDAMFSSSQSRPKRMMVTSCGCIFCIDCSGPATQADCVSCGAKVIKTLSLGRDLPPHVMELFTSNVNSLAKVGKRQAFKNRQFEKTAQP